MIEKLREFENKRPEIIFSWKDQESEAEGWAVINSLKGGAAGGGTRMRKGLDLKEVISLAKTMEIKFAVSGPNIGGAKSGINFDPSDPRKEEVLKRWFQAVIPLLKNYYGTGGDLNIDEIKEVLPITSALKLEHPQQGIVVGHLKAYKDNKKKAIQHLQTGVSKILKDEKYSPDIKKMFTVADMITGYGVAVSVLHYYSIWGGNPKEKRVMIQGFGNVGAPTAFYLAQAGMKIVCITDRDGGLISKEGFDLKEIKDLLAKRENNIIISPDKISIDTLNKELLKLNVDILIPAAGSRLLNKSMIEPMVNNGLELISSGANVPFDDNEIFFGETGLYADNNISVIPDFIANCGMARVFAYLMQTKQEITEKSIFDDVSKTIANILKKVYLENNSKTKISQKAMEITLNSINKN
ncbi:MAG: Glu/Leu/Phe/Val dehydrogenase [Candidatus Sericytochromatia bacterium]|nr:Glu/Leu/Phe/Val dehydrogenase [Candidatus Sericytochromatia bacterium]